MLRRNRSQKARDLLQRLAAGEPAPKRTNWRRFTEDIQKIEYGQPSSIRTLLSAVIESEHLPEDVRHELFIHVTGQPVMGVVGQGGEVFAESYHLEFDILELERVLAAKRLDVEGKQEYLIRCWWNQYKRTVHKNSTNGRPAIDGAEASKWARQAEEQVLETVRRAGEDIDEVLHLTAEVLSHSRSLYGIDGQVSELVALLEEHPPKVREVLWKLVEDDGRCDLHRARRYLEAAVLV